MNDCDIAEELSKICPGNYDAHAISIAAFTIYRKIDIDRSSKTENILLTLMAMDMGEEFALSEQEFCGLLAKFQEIQGSSKLDLKFIAGSICNIMMPPPVNASAIILAHLSGSHRPQANLLKRYTGIHYDAKASPKEARLDAYQPKFKR